jgi:hypothetical protein
MPYSPLKMTACTECSKRRVIFQNALLLQRRKLDKSGDFSASDQMLLSALGGNLSKPMCGSTKLDNTSLPLGQQQFPAYFNSF